MYNELLLKYRKKIGAYYFVWAKYRVILIPISQNYGDYLEVSSIF